MLRRPENPSALRKPRVKNQLFPCLLPPPAIHSSICHSLCPSLHLPKFIIYPHNPSLSSMLLIKKPSLMNESILLLLPVRVTHPPPRVYPKSNRHTTVRPNLRHHFKTFEAFCSDELLKKKMLSCFLVSERHTKRVSKRTVC